MSKAPTATYRRRAKGPQAYPVAMENALLLGEKAKFIDNLLLCELFLQHLPSNVQMIHASADEMTIDKQGRDGRENNGHRYASHFLRQQTHRRRRFLKNHLGRVCRSTANPEKVPLPPCFSAKWNRGGRNRSRRCSSSHGQSPTKQQANQEDVC